MEKGDRVKFAEIVGMNPSSHFEWLARNLQPMRVIRVRQTDKNRCGQLVTVRVGRWPGGIVLRNYDPAWFEVVECKTA
jgi:hypothetical protein